MSDNCPVCGNRGCYTFIERKKGKDIVECCSCGTELVLEKSERGDN